MSVDHSSSLEPGGVDMSPGGSCSVDHSPSRERDLNDGDCEGLVWTTQPAGGALTESGVPQAPGGSRPLTLA